MLNPELRPTPPAMAGFQPAARPADELAGFSAFIHTLFDAALPTALKHFRKLTQTDHKPGTAAFDPVTEADREVERVIRALIERHYPDHGVHGEEYGVSAPAAGCPWSWTIDPIDGTRAFITGVPVWGTLIALTFEGYPVAGGIGQGYTGERFVGTRYGSTVTYADGSSAPLQVRTVCDNPALGVGFCTAPDLFADVGRRAFERVRSGTRLIRYGADCYGYAMLAAGQADFTFEAQLQPYDVHALIPVIEGAGGIITRLDGGNPAEAGGITAAATPQMHQFLLDAWERRNSV